jgi:hypothetical protein
VLDDDEYSRVEQEMILEHWESYGRDDLQDVIAENLGGDNRTDLTDAAVEMINALVWTDLIDFWPSMIDVSAVDFGEKEIVEWLKPRIGQVVTLPNYGSSVTLDLRINNLIEV